MNRFLLSKYINLLLTESKADDLKKKYPNIDVDFYSANDPSQKNKYLEWMVKQAVKGHSKEDIVATVSYFHENLFKFQSKDINFYKDLKDLEDEAKKVSEKKSNTQQRKEVKSSGSDDIYEDDEVIVKYIKEKDACQVYGSGTKWCITMDDASYWETYTGNNVVFYFILRKSPKQDKFDKVAVSVERDLNNNILDIKYWDSEDQQPSKRKLPNLFSDFDKFLSLIKSHALTVPKGILAKINDGEQITAKETDQALEMYKDDQDTLLLILQNADKIEPEKLAELSKSEEEKIRVAIAKKPFLPIELLTIFAKDKNPEIRRSIAQNPSTPVSVLTELSKDKYESVRALVSQNPSTPIEVVLLLTADKKELVRLKASSNLSIPVKNLIDLSKHEDWAVRMNIAKNPNTPPKILIELSRDKDEHVRYYVVRNSNTPHEILIKLSKDIDVNVRKAAEEAIEKEV